MIQAGAERMPGRAVPGRHIAGPWFRWDCVSPRGIERPPTYQQRAHRTIQAGAKHSPASSVPDGDIARVLASGDREKPAGIEQPRGAHRQGPHSPTVDPTAERVPGRAVPGGDV